MYTPGWSNYRLQQSCEGYVFTGVCVSTGGVPDQVHPLYDQVYPPSQVNPLGHVHPWAGAPPPDQVHPPGQVHPLGPGTPPRPGTSPMTRYTPPGPGTPPRQVHPNPPEIQPLLQTVCILLECILVFIRFLN